MLRYFVPRFTIRSLFAVTTGLAVFLSTWLARSERQRRAVAALSDIELCQIGYEFNSPSDPKRWTRPPHRPGWVERLLGLDYAHSVVDVTLPAYQIDEAMPHLRSLPALRSIYTYGYDAKDEDDERQQLQDAFEKLRRSLPGVKAAEAQSAPILTTIIPVVG